MKNYSDNTKETFLDKIIPKNRFFRNMIYLIGDIFIVSFSAFFALLIRFELDFLSKGFGHYSLLLRNDLIYIIIITVIVFYAMRMYSTIWSVASIREAFMIFVSIIVVDLLCIITNVLLKIALPRSFYILFPFVFYALEMMWRFAYRIMRNLYPHDSKTSKRIMIVGAGEAGAQLLREIRSSHHMNGKVICFIDDNPIKNGKVLGGVNIYCGRDKIVALADKFKIEEIYVALPSASSQERKDIIEICSKTKCDLKVLPGIYQLVNGEVSISKLRDIDIEDLLGREAVKVNLDEILGYIKDKCVLITGGGGSIGSEISRQIASHKPSHLILLDIYENSVYDVQNELKHNFPALNMTVLIASVRDEKKIDKIFETYNPQIVFHAAAHKHVPLMETSPCEAIKNNCFGTLNVANAADKYNAEKFILISTDKAVNPTNIMGASKRICEMITQYKARHSKTNFALVRFGNVLGSNGSVIPLFKKQIEEGGPVTVTHPDIIRYFMTIPEAVALVLQAGAYAKGGEVFVLDMGKPVKILDMAKNLIRLAGYEPDVDIKIEFTGLRPGEKLYEELLMSEEGLQDTDNKLIHIGKPIELDENNFLSQLENIKILANNNVENMKIEVAKVVDTYKPYLGEK